jgi:Fe-S oxidoreductase
MNPVAMALVLIVLIGMFVISMRKRIELLRVGDATHESRLDQPERRLNAVWMFALFQKKLRYYWLAGIAHQLIFLGFFILLLRSVVLWGRGFDPAFNLLILGPDGFLGLPLGHIYAFVKDVFAVLVLFGASVFLIYRTVVPQKRMSLNAEGLLIVAIYFAMMLADILYDGAARVLHVHADAMCANAPNACEAIRTVVAPLGESPAAVRWEPLHEPAGSLLALLLDGAGPELLVVLSHVGFWSHSVLVLVFMNILPYSKQFHEITAIPNVYMSDLTKPGRLRPIAKDTEALMGLVEKASEGVDMNRARIGYSRIEHFTWKDVLDFYSCTECGRCSDHCPAFTTGKKLSPKQLTLDLRNHLYGRQDEVMRLEQPIPRWQAEVDGTTPADSDAETASGGDAAKPSEGGAKWVGKNLLPDVIDPDVIWACTTCRACEEQCPVLITYVDKIVQMRRHEVMIKGDSFPSELNKPFEGMEVNGNPWNLSRMDRANWASGLEIPMAAEKPDAPVLYWVGCAASYDDRAKRVARATATLLKRAGVDFAILGQEETCTGDPARRAGNEYLFSMLAETNVATLNGYKEQGGVKQILTTCPHCFNTLMNEYPDFGGKYEVVHHTDFILGLLAEKRLVPRKPVTAKVAYHDSCYLGRYNGIYEPPRDILRRIPGVELVEPELHHNKGLCCGAGGAQMWMEEQNKDRVNIKRTNQLLATGANVVSSACPFCMTMLTDGLKSQEKESTIRQLDVIELLAESCDDAADGALAAE